MTGDKQDDFLHVNIDLPTFKFEIKTDQPVSALPELRRILETLNLDEDIVYAEFVTEELKTVFSETFVKNSQVMTSIKKLLKQEDDYRIATAVIPSKATIDLDNKTKSVELQRKDVQHAVARMTDHIDSKLVKQGIVHINGVVDREGNVLIVDYIHKYMPTAQLRAFHSKGAGDKVVVECIFFGDFPEEEE